MRSFILSVVFASMAVTCLHIDRAFAFYLLPSKQLDIEVETGVKESYDDNITLVKNNTKKDMVTDLIVAIRAKYEGKRQKITASLQDVQQFYALNPSFNKNNQYATIDYQAELTSKDRITIKENGAHYYSPTGFEEAFGRTGGFYSTLSNKLGGDYVHDFTKQLQTDVGYDSQFYIFGDNSGQRNSFSNQARAGSTYLYDSETQFSLWYNFENRMFDGIKGTGSVNSALAGIRRYFTTQLYLDAQGGLDINKTFSGDVLPKPAVAVTLTGELNKRTQLDFSFVNRSRTSGYETDLFNYWQISSNLKRQLWQRLSTVLGIFYGSGTYHSMNITDHFLGWNGGLDYDIWHNIKGSLLYTFYDLSSSQSSRDYLRNLVSLKISAIF